MKIVRKPHRTHKLIGDIRSLINRARDEVAHVVDSGLVHLYWSIGHRLRVDIMKEKRAAYGEEIVTTVSRQLTQEYGQGYSRQNLFHMIRLIEIFPDEKIVSTLSRQLGWSHFKEILYLNDRLKREYYAQMCRLERWSVRTLRKKIGSMLFERTALSKKLQTWPIWS